MIGGNPPFTHDLITRPPHNLPKPRLWLALTAALSGDACEIKWNDTDTNGNKLCAEGDLCGCSHSGGFVITITGRNFGRGLLGNDGNVKTSVMVHTTECANVTHVMGKEHTELTCVVGRIPVSSSVVTVVNEGGSPTTSNSIIQFSMCDPGYHEVNAEASDKVVLP